MVKGLAKENKFSWAGMPHLNDTRQQCQFCKKRHQSARWWGREKEIDKGTVLTAFLWCTVCKVQLWRSFCQLQCTEQFPEHRNLFPS